MIDTRRRKKNSEYYQAHRAELRQKNNEHNKERLKNDPEYREKARLNTARWHKENDAIRMQDPEYAARQKGYKDKHDHMRHTLRSFGVLKGRLATKIGEEAADKVTRYAVAELKMPDRKTYRTLTGIKDGGYSHLMMTEAFKACDTGRRLMEQDPEDIAEIRKRISDAPEDGYERYINAKYSKTPGKRHIETAEDTLELKGKPAQKKTAIEGMLATLENKLKGSIGREGAARLAAYLKEHTEFPDEAEYSREISEEGYLEAAEALAHTKLGRIILRGDAKDIKAIREVLR